MPSFVNINLGAEEKSIQVVNSCIDCMKGKCRQKHDWVFTASMIRSVRFVSKLNAANIFNLISFKKIYKRATIKK